MSTSGKHRVIVAGSVRGAGDPAEVGDESRATLPGHPPIPTAASLTTRNGDRERLEPTTCWCQRWSARVDERCVDRDAAN